MLAETAQDAPLVVHTEIGVVWDLGELSPTPPACLTEWLDWHIRNKAALADVENSRTGFVLIRETFEPHVECVDELSRSVVDLSKEEYDQLLDLYRTESDRVTS